MNQVEFDALIKSRVQSWQAPTVLALQNEPTPQTKNAHEFIKFTAQYGFGFLDESVGVRTVDGSSVEHTFILRFDVFTKINTGTARASEICQNILNYWQVKKLADGATTIAGSIQDIGEESPHYHMAVLIPGQREEFLTV